MTTMTCWLDHLRVADSKRSPSRIPLPTSQPHAGNPKAVMISHDSIIFESRAARLAIGKTVFQEVPRLTSEHLLKISFLI